MKLLRALKYRDDNRVLSYPIKKYPEIYNQFGEKMEMFYLKDQIMAPYSGSRYFIWDRCNYGLDTHFYTHNNMLFTCGQPSRKYGLLIESRQIVPDNYLIFKKNRGLADEFDAVFTYDEELLSSLPNAKFFPSCAGAWYGDQQGKFCWDQTCYQKKSKQISIVSSDKKMCPLHEVRIELSKYCKRNGLADTFGTFDGGKKCLIDDSLTDYRYSIVIENDVTNYFFTEKIINCFAAQTIPIYLGARKISDFFNAGGIIMLNESQIGDIERVLRRCTVEYYQEHLDAIIDNFNRAYAYQNVYDWLYEHYFRV